MHEDLMPEPYWRAFRNYGGQPPVDLYTADQLRAYGDKRAADALEAMQAALDCLRLVVGSEEAFCKAAHHAKADQHDPFYSCPVHARAVAAIDATRSKT